MANGIDWFRWHHGSVTDPKFQLIAKKAGASLPDVLAVWAYILESASASDARGSFSDIDAEALDCLFSFPDGRTADILAMLGTRGLISGNTITAWEKRQPKREREDVTAADRKRAQRERDKAKACDIEEVTPSHATSHQFTPREEERREEKRKADNDDSTGGGYATPSSSPLPEREDPPPNNSPAIALSVALRKLGVDAMFTHPAVLDWTQRGIKPEVLEQAVEMAREQKGPDAKIPPNYLVPIVEKLLNPPAAAPAHTRQAAPIALPPARKPQGNDPKGPDESFDEWRARTDAYERAHRQAAQP